MFNLSWEGRRRHGRRVWHRAGHRVALRPPGGARRWCSTSTAGQRRIPRRRLRPRGGSAGAAACDVSDAARGDVGVRAASSRDTRRLDILVNNAGIAHVGTIERTSGRGSRPPVSRERQGRVPVHSGGGAGDGPAGWRRHSQHGVDRVVHRRGRSLCVFDDQGRRAHDDEIGGGRLRQAERAVQLHLPGAHPDAVRRRIREEELPGPRSGRCCRNCPSTSRSGAWARRKKWRIWRCICAPTKRRSSRARRTHSTAECSTNERQRHVFTLNLKDDPAIDRRVSRHHRERLARGAGEPPAGRRRADGHLPSRAPRW